MFQVDLKDKTPEEIKKLKIEWLDKMTVIERGNPKWKDGASLTDDQLELLANEVRKLDEAGKGWTLMQLKSMIETLCKEKGRRVPTDMRSYITRSALLPLPFRSAISLSSSYFRKVLRSFPGH